MGDDVGKCLLGVVKVVPLTNIIGERPHLDDEVKHFIDELGLSEGVIAFCNALLAFMEPHDQHGKWSFGVPWVNYFLFVLDNFLWLYPSVCPEEPVKNG